MPNYLGDADNYIPGQSRRDAGAHRAGMVLPAVLRDPALDPEQAAGVAAMFSAIIVLAFLPWLDTARTRSANYRPLDKQFFWMFVVVCVLLGYLGSQPPEGIYVIAGAHPDLLLLRLFPDPAAAARPDRKAEAGSEFDRRRCAGESGRQDGADGVDGDCPDDRGRAVRRQRASMPGPPRTIRRRRRNGRSPDRSASTIAARCSAA